MPLAIDKAPRAFGIEQLSLLRQQATRAAGHQNLHAHNGAIAMHFDIKRHARHANGLMAQSHHAQQALQSLPVELTAVANEIRGDPVHEIADITLFR